MVTVASRAELERLLEDDVPHGDLTTEALGIGAVSGVMRFSARAPMVLALAEDAAAIIEFAGAAWSCWPHRAPRSGRVRRS